MESGCTITQEPWRYKTNKDEEEVIVEEENKSADWLECCSVGHTSTLALAYGSIACKVHWSGRCQIIDDDMLPSRWCISGGMPTPQNVSIRKHLDAFRLWESVFSSIGSKSLTDVITTKFDRFSSCLSICKRMYMFTWQWRLNIYYAASIYSYISFVFGFLFFLSFSFSLRNSFSWLFVYFCKEIGLYIYIYISFPMEKKNREPLWAS